MRVESFIGLHFLRSTRQDRSISFITWVSMVGVTLGVMALIVTISVMNGFRDNLFLAVTGTQPHARVELTRGGLLDAETGAELLRVLAEQDDVVAVAPYFSRQVFLRSGSEFRAAILRGVDPVREAQVTALPRFLGDTAFEPLDLDTIDPVEGAERLGRLGEMLGRGIILGAPMARALGVEVGDTVDIVSPEQRMTPIGPVPLIKRATLVAVFETGIGGTDDVLAFTDLDLARRLFRLRGGFDAVAVRVADPDQVDPEALAEAVRAVTQADAIGPDQPRPDGISADVRNGRRGDASGASSAFVVRTWKEENRNVFQVMKLEKIGLFLILTLIILVAFFNIIASLIMLVLEKTKGIAILKTLGATNGMIRRIFFMQGIWIGTAGTVAGVGLGLLICWVLATFDFIRLPPGVYPVSTRLPIRVDWFDLLSITAASLLICLSVTLYPSTRAARIDPVVNLRNE